MAVIHVSGGGDALKNAVSGASSGDVILVADGTYNPITSNDFGSKSLTIRSDHGPSKCIIDGGGTTMCITGNRGVSVYGVTFANGYVGNGGVVHRASAYQCIFRDCVVLGYGGVAYEGQSIFDCVFDNCMSGRMGVVSKCPSIKRCLFKNCHGTLPSEALAAIIDSGSIVDSCVFESCGDGTEYILVSATDTTKNCLFLNIPAETGTGKCIVKYGKVLECAFVGCGARTSMFVDNDDMERNVFLPIPANTKVSNIERTFSSNVVNGNVSFGSSSATTVQPITGNVVSGVISIPAGSPAKVAGNMTNVQSLPPFWGGPGGMPEMPSNPESLIAKFPMLKGIGPSWMWGGGVKYKPYDAEVEYLESTSEQWIDTGSTIRSTWSVSVTCSVTTTTVNQAIWSARKVTGPDEPRTDRRTDSLFVINTTNPSSGRFDYGIEQTAKFFNFSGWSGVHEYKTVGGQFFIDGTKYAEYTDLDFETGGPLRIFAEENINDPGTFNIFCVGKIYAAKVLDANGVLVRDFIPVRVGSGANAVGYLYDKANPTGGPLGNGLYPNSGTGAFVIGPDIG